jgi:excisionase family DNA binding protein
MMSTDEEISDVPRPGAIKLAHERLNELFERLGPRLQSDVQQELFRGVQAILDDVLKLMPDAAGFFSVADAAKLLFVSRSHVLKLIEQGKLELHHKPGTDLFVSEASLRGYQANHEAAVQTYQASAADEE